MSQQQLIEQLAAVTLQNNELIKQLAASLGDGTHLKTAATVHNAVRLHGQTGIFSGPGLERDVISAYVRPMGLASKLRVIPSVNENPIFPSITGFTATTGSQPTNACEDAPHGYMKGCNLTAQFGLKRFDTNTIEMDKVMLRVNRGDFTDLILHGELLTDLGLSPSGMNQQQILNVITMAEMIIAGVAMERALGVDLWQGTVAGGTFPGLDVQIATGQVDALANVACPALDSDVKDFNYNDVCGNVLDIVEYLSMMARYLEWNAQGMGLDPVNWVIAMRPDLWYELSACWPCSYMSNRCKNDAGTRILVVNDGNNVQERDRMRRSMTIPINGIDYPVVLDTGIYEYNNINNANLAAGQYASSIYFVPLSIRGGFPTTYIEYVDYRQASTNTALLNGTEDFWWTDAGRFSWAVEQIKWCYKLALKTEERVVLRTPQLAGKLQHVRYTPLQHLRDNDPASPYNFDGGVSTRAATTYHAVWER